MLAPCITVLSTSKNAAADASVGGVSADSTSRGRRRGLASQDGPHLEVARARTLLGHDAERSGARPLPALWIGPCPGARRRGAGVSRCRREPDRVAVVGRPAAGSPGPSSTTRWAGSRPDWDFAGVVGAQRVLVAIGNRLEFVTTYLGVLRAQAVAVPVSPRSTVDELARMLGTPARGSRWPTPGHRRRRAGAAAATLRGRRGSSWWVSRRTTSCGRAGPTGAAAAGPGEARGAALHQRHLRPTTCGDAHAPGAAGERRSGRAGGAADDPRRRRGAGGAADVPRLRTQRRPGQRAAAPGAPGPGRAVRPRRDAGGDRRRAVHGPPGRPPSSRTGRTSPTSSTGCSRCAWSSRGRPRSRRRWPSSSTARTGIPVQQGYGLTEAAPS